jgi:hypothetical protein
MDNLPSDWQCVQLMSIKENLSEVKLRKREWDDWSVTAYIITREYAKKIIDAYCIGENEYDFTIQRADIMPIIENLIYDLDTTYCIPLFAENTSFISTFHKVTMEDEHKKDHLSSAKFVIDWWKTNGKTVDIKDLMKL